MATRTVEGRKQDRKPKSPFPKQKQETPGRESELRPRPRYEAPEYKADHTFRTNIHAYFWLAKAALPHLQPGSSIIHTSSITGLRGSEHLLDYSSTKGAINAFTKSLAQMLVKKGIRVNCVAPGPVWTPLNPADEGKTPAQVAEFGGDTPMGRPAQPEEMAPAYMYFASQADSSYVTGEVLTLLGGETVGG